jgi:hypothetical protein
LKTKNDKEICLPSMACKLSLNCVCIHFDNASWVRVVENKHFASRSLLDNSAWIEWLFVVGGVADFNSVHGVLE